MTHCFVLVPQCNAFVEQSTEQKCAVNDLLFSLTAFYDCSGNNFDKQYMVTGFQHSILSMDYWYVLLTFGPFEAKLYKKYSVVCKHIFFQMSQYCFLETLLISLVSHFKVTLNANSVKINHYIDRYKHK